MIDVPAFVWPGPMGLGASSDTLNAAEEYSARVFAIPKTGTLKKVGIRTSSTSTGTWVARVCLETVADSVGAPIAPAYADRTLYATGSESGALTTTELPANTTVYVALNDTTGVSVTKGDLVTLSVRMVSISSGSLLVNIRTGSSGTLGGNAFAQIPYGVTYLNSTASQNSSVGMISLEYDGEIIPTPGHIAGNTGTLESWMSSSNPDRRGIKFQVPYGCRLEGVQVHIDTDVDCNLILYDSDEYSVVSGFPVTMTANRRKSTAIGATYVKLPTAVTLLANTTYRLVVLPSTTTNISIFTATYTDDSSLTGISAEAAGVNCIYTTFNGTPNSGSHAWTDTNTKRPSLVLSLDGLDIPTNAEIAAATWAYASRTLTA